MKSTVAILSLIVSLLAPQLRAGDPPKKPGPEHKKLEVLTGKWKWEENLERTPWPVFYSLEAVFDENPRKHPIFGTLLFSDFKM